MTGISLDGIEIDRDFTVPPSAVYTALTTPEGFARWFGGGQVRVPVSTLDYVPEPGRGWTAEMVLPDGTTISWAGDFIEVAPDERLVLTITDQPADPARAKIAIELTPTSTGTRMRFTQETPGFSTEQQHGLLAGWQSFIDELEQLVTREHGHRTDPGRGRVHPTER